jgi:spermidine synthase
MKSDTKGLPVHDDTPYRHPFRSKSHNGCLFFSGISALVYQIVWGRMLGLAIGTAVTAWAAVLAAFMGGMALGSVFGGRVADRTVKPLQLLAIIELSIGVYGLLSPLLLRGMQYVCTILPPFAGIQVVVAIITLIVPTMLMGATFPLISRALVTGNRPAGQDLGSIYAANTTGAIIGTLTAGFILLSFAGMSAALMVAATINIAVAAVLFFRFRNVSCGNKHVVPNAETPVDALVQPVSRFLFPAVITVSGFCAMAFEILWSRTLVFFLSSTTYSFTIVLSVVLVGLAAGGAAAAVIAKKTDRTTTWIAAMQLFTGVYGFIALFLLRHLDTVVHFNESTVTNVWPYWIAVRFAASFILIFPPACCMGVSFPLIIGVASRSRQSIGGSVGRLTALNTAGGIAGSLAAAFLLIPVAGIQRSLLLIAGLNWLAGITVLALGTTVAKRILAPVAFGLPLLCFFLLRFAGIEPMVRYSHLVRSAGTAVSLLSYKEDPAAGVAVLQTPRDRKLNIDGFNAAGTYKYEYMHLLAHLPVLLAPSPDTALVICLGSGTTCGITALYPQVQRVDCAEISKAVIASTRYFSDVNYQATTNPKVRIHLADGRNHLLRNTRRYDVITLEPMLPYLASATNLYSADFYKLCRSRLTEHGVMAQWAPMHVLSPREYRMLIASFVSVFPHTSLWVSGSEGILIGTMDSLRIDLDILKQTMAHEAPMSDLIKISLYTPERLLSCFMMDEQEARAYIGDVPVITDDRHGLEFSAPYTP